MAKGSRTGKSKAIVYPGYLHLHKPLLESEDFRSLSGQQVKLLVDVAYQYKGYNNGDLCASLAVLKNRGWNSNDTITRNLKVLLMKDLLMQTRQGGLGIGPSLFAITWQPINECGGKLDVKPTLNPPRSFKY